MYAIVKNPDETFYTSTVFCHVKKLNEHGWFDVDSEYYIVLNQEKTKLIKVMNQPKELRYLMPQVLELDTDLTDWIITREKNYLGVVDFLSDIDFDSDDWVVPQELTERCIEIDSRRKYVEFADIKTETDINNIFWTTRRFHDGYIDGGKEERDSLYLRFTGLIGCDLELYFSGDVEHNIDSFSPDDFDPDIFDTPEWYDVSIFFEDGYTYLVRGAVTKRSEIHGLNQYVRARNLKYRIVPIYKEGWQYIIR